MHNVTVREHPPRLDNVADTIRFEFDQSSVSLSPGQSVAIGVGSRGLANAREIVLSVIEWVRDQGAIPFLVPAMGSHGGATARGQQLVLESYGLAEAETGVEIRSSLDVDRLPSDGLPVEVYIDRHAANADAIILINRVKPHTDFTGPHESGLVKMSAIGLGNRHQADAIHGHGPEGLRDLIPRVSERVLQHSNVVAGLGVVENSHDETLAVRVATADTFHAVDAELLEVARENVPRIHADHLDILIVEQMGKNISGTGIDTKAVGRMLMNGVDDPPRPTIKSIYARTLTEESHGNALGMGIADVIGQHVADNLDLDTTYENVVTSGGLRRGFVPVVARDDDFAWRALVRNASLLDLPAARVMIVRSTLETDRFLASEAVVRDLPSDQFVVDPEPVDLFVGDEIGWLADQANLDWSSVGSDPTENGRRPVDG